MHARPFLLRFPLSSQYFSYFMLLPRIPTIRNPPSRYLKNIESVLRLPRHPPRKTRFLAHSRDNAQAVFAAVTALLDSQSIHDAADWALLVCTAVERYTAETAYRSKTTLVRSDFPRADPSVPARCEDEVGEGDGGESGNVAG